jgi:hypothetical protein
MSGIRSVLNKAKQSKAAPEKGKDEKKSDGHMGFNSLARKVAKEYGSKEAGQKVAAKVYWEKQAKRG